MTANILIINTNPLLNLVHRDHFEPGTINRVPSMEIHAEGKGVNVGRVLARLGHSAILTGFAGGHSGAWLRDLIRAEGIEDDFVETAAPIRVGFMASSPLDQHPTTVLPNGFPVTRDECGLLLKRVRERLDQVQLVIISGSVPDPMADSLYADILELCQQAAMPCWLDAHGLALTQALETGLPVALAKPNREEYAQSCHWNQVKELHITDGEGPIEVQSLKQGNWRVIPPDIRQVNPVGSGDCYLAGLAHGYLLGWPMHQRLVFASAAGAANALENDVAMIRPDDIQSLMAQVNVTHLD